MAAVNTVWIFDIDGVVTSPSDKKVKEPQILVHIADKLKSGEPVAFNTGRSLSWLIDRVINPLLILIDNRNVLENFIAVGEKGSTWLTFAKDGKMQEYKDDNILIPKSLQQLVKKLIKKNYSKSMFFDDSKQTMISIEMHDGYSIDEFKKDQVKLIGDLKKILQENIFSDKFKIDPSTIATDIENIHVGKSFATDRILELLKKKGKMPKQFIAFGDSPSDIETAKRLHEKNLSFSFIFVDNKGQFKGVNHPFPIVYTKDRFDKGTLEFLHKHSKKL